MPERILHIGCLLGSMLCCTACTNTANKDTLKHQSDVLLLNEVKIAPAEQEDTSRSLNDSTGIFMYQGMIIKL